MTEPDPQWAAYRRAVGERLRAARRQAGLTQERLAQRTGVSRDTIQRVERGEGEIPRLAALWRLARALDMPTAELLADPA